MAAHTLKLCRFTKLFDLKTEILHLPLMSYISIMNNHLSV